MAIVDEDVRRKVEVLVVPDPSKPADKPGTRHHDEALRILDVNK